MSLNLDDMDMTAKLSIKQDGMTGTRTCLCPWNTWASAVDQLMGQTIIINNKPIVFGASNWPGIPLLTVSAIDIELWGRAAISDFESGPVADYAKLTISYDTKDKEGEDNEDQPEPDPNDNGGDDTVLIQSLDYAVDIITVPVKVTTTLPIYGADGVPISGSKTREVKKYIRVPNIIYTATIPEVKKPKWSLLQDKLGMINTDVIFGGAAGTVLFDGPHADRELKKNNKNKSWKISGKFIYNPKGWNKMIHPDTLEWIDADALNGGNKPYEETALKPILNSLNLS